MPLDNDDDLFDYDPDLEHQPNIISDHSVSTLNKEEKDFVDSIKDSESSGGNINNLETKLSIAYISSSTHFVSNEASPTGHAYAVRHIMDELSDGRFSLIELFKTTELKIQRLMAFLQISNSIFGIDPKAFQESLKELFDIEVSDIHVRTVYHTHMAISRHSLLLSRALYQNLSEHLDMSVIPELLDDSSDIDDLDLSYHSIVSNIHQNIIQHFSEHGLSDKVSEVFGLNANLYQK